MTQKTHTIHGKENKNGKIEQGFLLVYNEMFYGQIEKLLEKIVRSTALQRELNLYGRKIVSFSSLCI